MDKFDAAAKKFITAEVNLNAISTEGSTRTSDDIEIESAKNKVKVCFSNFKNAWDSYLEAMQNYIDVLTKADGSTTSSAKLSAWRDMINAERNFSSSRIALMYAKSDLLIAKSNNIQKEETETEVKAEAEAKVEAETEGEKDAPLNKVVLEFEKKLESAKHKHQKQKINMTATSSNGTDAIIQKRSTKRTKTATNSDNDTLERILATHESARAAVANSDDTTTISQERTIRKRKAFAAYLRSLLEDK